MVTGGTDASFTGVYKLAARDDGKGGLAATIKFSDNPEKTTNPGIKQVWRVRDSHGFLIADVMSLDDSSDPDIIENGKTYSFWHPQADYRRFNHTVDGSAQPMLAAKLINGSPSGDKINLKEIRERVSRELESLDQSYKRFLNPHVYKVSITGRLRNLKLELIKNYLGEL
jgi:nicotinate phosphoribosyltransferase